MTDDLSPAELEDLEMELALAGFRNLVEAEGVVFRLSHCIAFRAGWTAARSAEEKLA